MKKDKINKILKSICMFVGTIASSLLIWTKFSENKRKKDEELNKDTYEEIGVTIQNVKKSFYEKYMKRLFDIVISIMGIVILSPIFIVTAVAIFVSDPGSVIFTQKRVGVNKTFFKMYKFRSMKMSTPHDVPTHMLDNPESYITTVGKFIRKTSIDELPQLFNILEGNLSVVGPRPALWNQEDLVAERDKYCANDVMPGLTGWAQINGRDELEIADKAKLDGDYVERLRRNNMSGLLMDIKCFFGTITSVLKSDGVVEGGTGELHKQSNEKILFLANHFITLYSFRRELIERLVQEGYKVFISFPEDENDYFLKLGCNIILTEVDRRGVNPIKDIKLIANYRKIINKVKPDIIFSYTIKPNIYGCMVSNGKFKQICNITGTGATFLKKSIVSEICKLLYKVSIKKCYKVFFQNSGDKDYFVNNRLVNNNYELLPGSGCNLKENEYVPISESDTIRFIFIGRVMELKGIDEYLDAAKVIKEKYSNTEFIIAGWNEEKKYKELIESYEKAGIVSYIGFRNDIKEWIQSSHCTVLPSRGGEGVPNVLLESAATGRVCIGSDIAGTKDVIKDGETGFLFEVGNSQALCEKMVTFINMPYSEKQMMGQKARKHIEDNFDRTFVIDRYMDEVRRLKNV